MTIICEYIWLGGQDELRSKTRVLTKMSNYSGGRRPALYDIPKWNYDGSSTGQAQGHDSEIILNPVAIYKNPLTTRLDYSSYLVLCDTYKPDGQPLENNHRPWAKAIFDQVVDEHPWFGIEQEYFIMEPERINGCGTVSSLNPCGNTWHRTKGAQGQYYCSVGAQNAFGRNIVEEHMYACLEAGISISGTNAEVAPGQWEYQIGPCEGIDSADQTIVSRYLLVRIAEKHGVVIDIEPKPLKGDWNGSGCHTNFSTLKMRIGDAHDDGIHYINEAITRLKGTHDEHMRLYGSGNEDRMTGEHETASYHEFSYGRANRGASVRIGNETITNGEGYFEDRRPSSNMNPYLVTAKLCKTCCGLQEPLDPVIGN